MNKALEKTKDYVFTRGLGYILTVPAIIFVILSLAFYNGNGINMYSPEFDPSIFACLSVSLVLLVASMCVDVIPVQWSRYLVKPLRIFAYLLCVYSIFLFLTTQSGLIGAMMYELVYGTAVQDPYQPLVPGFIATAVFMAVAAVISLVSACINFWRPWAKKEADSADGENSVRGADDENR